MSETNPIQIIEEKLQALMHRYQKSVAENNKLKIEIQDLSTQLAIAKKDKEELSKKLDASQVGIQNWDAADKKNLQNRIDEYLKEIDHCLKLLNA